MPAVDELVALIAHAAANPNALPRDQRNADTLDALALIACLRPKLDEWELKLVQNARRPGSTYITLREYAAAVGLNSGQSADTRFLRLLSTSLDASAALKKSKPIRNENVGRLARSRPSREIPWLARNGREVRAITKALIDTSEAFIDVQQDDIEELAEALAADPGPGPVGTELTAMLLTFAGEAASFAAPGTELAAAVLARAQELRTDHWRTVDPKPKPKTKRAADSSTGKNGKSTT